MAHPEYKSIGSIEDRVVEEIGEVLQAMSKAKRFGYKNYHPDRPYSDNTRELLLEIVDLQTVLLDYQKQLEDSLAERPEGE